MMLKGDNMKVVISGGGTGGHIYPAVAIIEELKKRDSNIDILYIGSKNSMESELIPSLGINYKSPIVVEESNEIIFFPTASPRVEDCHWISLKHVDKLEKNGLKTKILFKNGQELNLSVSYGSLENQLLRATRLQSIMRDRKIA